MQRVNFHAGATGLTPMTANTDARPWVSMRAAARIIGVSPKTAGRLAREGRIRSRLIPGMARQYSRDDAFRVASEAVAVGVGDWPGGK